MARRRNTKAAIFDRCARSVRTTLGNGRSTPVQIENMERGRKLLLVLIRDITSRKPKYTPFIERALRDLHTHTEYCDATLIRDLADVCVTLNRLERGARRSNRDKLIEAGFLCEYLKDEFSQAPRGTSDAAT